MKRKHLAIAAALLSLALVACLGIWRFNRYWQSRLSPEVKNAFCSSLSPNASESDLVYYIREAKLASRTKRDADVIGSLDNFAHAAADEAQRQQQEWNRLLQGVRDPCLQYEPQSVSLAYCAEELKQKAESDKEMDSLDDTQIKADEAVVAELRPKLKAQQQEYCSGPSALDELPTPKP